jgi:hypothetical protein
VDRELTYRLPFARLRRLGRNSGRKAHPLIWGARWILLISFFVALWLVTLFADAVERWQASVGLPQLTVLVSIILVVGIAALFLRRAALRRTQTCADFDAEIRLRRDEGGLRIATGEIEYYLKWPGISQMFMEHDGVVVSHGNLFFLVPDSAFESADERVAFIRDVYGRLGAEARSRSENSIRPMLDAAAAPTGG